MQDPAQQLITSLGKLRQQAKEGLSKLPAVDPMRKVLQDIDGNLERTERMAQARISGVGIYGPDPLGYLQKRMKKLESDVRQAAGR